MFSELAQGPRYRASVTFTLNRQRQRSVLVRHVEYTNRVEIPINVSKPAVSLYRWWLALNMRNPAAKEEYKYMIYPKSPCLSGLLFADVEEFLTFICALHIGHSRYPIFSEVQNFANPLM